MAPELPAHLEAKITRQPDGCWVWTAAHDGRGYGVASVNRVPQKAHRVVYELLVGEIADDLELDHLCRVKLCVNPSHLEEVTHAENMRRAGLSGIAAANAAKTHCPKGHPYDEAHPGARRCRTCRRETVREAQRRHRAKERSRG